MDTIKVIKETLKGRKPLVIEDNQSRFRHGAVLIPLFRDNGEYKVLFTKRTNRLETHKGQISFPGGSVDEEDDSLEETALREAYEEVGILREDVTLLGRVDDTFTLASNFIIHPFVGLIPYPYHFQINRQEVKRLIEVPLTFFLEKDLVDRMGDVDYGGGTYHGLTFPYKGDVIWGATARIMGDFKKILGGKLSLPPKDA